MHYINHHNNELGTSLWTTAFTLIGGVIIFIIQRVVERLYFDPINKQKEVIENVAVDLIKFAKLYANPEVVNTHPSDSSRRREFEFASDKTRELSALLSVRTNNINAYKFWYDLKYIKVSKEKALEAAGKIMILSNGYFQPGRGVANADCADEIRDLLNIPRSN